MIINETVLKEKFAEGDYKAYDYLIDNAETDEQVEMLINLQNMPEANEPTNTAYVQNDEGLIKYIEEQNKVFAELGIDLDLLLK